MAQDDLEDLAGDPAPGAPRRRWLGRAALALLAVLALALVALWLGRERIAGDVITDQLRSLDLPATYRIESIGPRKQVLGNVVVGDPARPDLTIERVEVTLSTRFGVPAIGSVRLVRPRLYGTYRDGRLSLGSLDKVLFKGPSTEPFRLFDLDVAIVDGRGLMVTDFGRVGAKLEGAGSLRAGFKGIAAAVAPRLASGGCAARQVTLFGRLDISDERPRFDGPLRSEQLDCPATGLRFGRTVLQIESRFDKALDGAEGRVGARAQNLVMATSRVPGLAGSARFTWRKGALTARYDLAAARATLSQATIAAASTEGVLRASGSLARVEAEGTAEARGIDLRSRLDATLAAWQRASVQTLAEPLLAKLRAGLRRESPGSALSARYILRRSDGRTSLNLPEATLRGGSGEILLAASRLQVATGANGAPLVTGNFATGGAGLPRIVGRMERASGGSALRLAMADYVAGDARLAIPALFIVQERGGAVGLSGRAELSGALPGGRAQNLVLPLDGTWSGRGGLALWRRCSLLRFDRLQYANLSLDRRALSLCPPRGSAALRSTPKGLRFAAGASSLDVAGRLGATPIRIASGPIGFAVPGNLSARALRVTLGPKATASHFDIGGLTARIGKSVSGRFSGSEIRLSAVPLDMTGAEGAWSYGNGRLEIGDAAFALSDRDPARRFEPLQARQAGLSLFANRIVAEATLREPRSAREVVRTHIVHDLASGRGGADLFVDELRFDSQVQPDELTGLALGVIANATGSVRGTGRIDWNPQATTSSGTFSTDSLDFAAVFGPVKGLSGTVRFTDLLGLVTAPDQRLRVASVNPGIEVNDGEIRFALQPDSRLLVHGATWPFLGGTLELAPVTMNLGVSETRRYTLKIDGLDGARLVERMNLANVSLTGVFDGQIPLVFDENGGRIDVGTLRSRPPGGNLSYVGELTYKDLSPMANFAFDTLRSLDYREMGVELEGSLEGEIITRLKFAGIRQGAGAKKNFLTRRIAALPIRFNVNIKAPFFQLVTSLRSMYDPAYVRDPRSLGLLDEKGHPLAPQATATSAPGRQGTAIQPSESAKGP